MMAKRYELSDGGWVVVADLLTKTHGRGRPRLCSANARWGTLLRGCVARYAGALWSVIDDVSTISGLAKQGAI